MGNKIQVRSPRGNPYISLNDLLRTTHETVIAMLKYVLQWKAFKKIADNTNPYLILWLALPFPSDSTKCAQLSQLLENRQLFENKGVSNKGAMTSEGQNTTQLIILELHGLIVNLNLKTKCFYTNQLILAFTPCLSKLLKNMRKQVSWQFGITDTLQRM